MIEFFVKGGPVMYPLLACSIISLTVIIERALFWIREDVHRDQAMVNDVLELCRKGNWEEVRALVKRSKDYIIRIIVSGILHAEPTSKRQVHAQAARAIDRRAGQVPPGREIAVVPFEVIPVDVLAGVS